MKGCDENRKQSFINNGCSWSQFLSLRLIFIPEELISYCLPAGCDLGWVMTFLLFTPKLSLSQRKKENEILPHLISGNHLSTQREKQIHLRLFQLNRNKLESSQHFYGLFKQQWCRSSAALDHSHGLPWSGCHKSFPHSEQEFSQNLMSV